MTPRSRLSAALRPALLFFFALAVLPAISSAGSVTGRVVDPQGQPVSGANVSVEGPLGSLGAATSDAEGRFALAAIPPGEWRVVVVADGFRAEPLRIAIKGSATVDTTIHLHVSALQESIVVSASHVETPLSRLPTSATVVGAAELRALQAESVSEALQLVPGLQVARSGGRLGLTSVFPRGGESDFTLVAVDGLRVNSFGGGFDFATLPLGDVERIEVVRGPQSAVFGADAIGGLVQIVTRSGGPPRLHALAEGGGFGTARADVSAAGTFGAVRWGGSMERSVSDGFTGTAPATGERVTNDDGRATAGSMTAAFVRGAVEARAHVRAGSTTRGFPGPFGRDPNGTFEGVDRVARGTTEVRAGGLTAAWTAGRVRYRGEIGRSEVDGRFTSRFDVAESDTRRTDGRVHADVALGSSTGLSFGVEAITERGGSTYVTGERFQPIPVKRRAVGSYAELRLEPSSRLFVSAGVRAEHIRRAALEADPSAFAPRSRLEDDTVVAVSPRVAASWFARPAASGGWTRVHASAGTGLRPPDVFEIAFTDNPSLAPERSRSVDVGVEHAMAGGRVVLDATWFANRYDDLIVAVGRAFADASRFRTDNIANARARGVEVSGTARSPWGGQLRASYTVLATEVLSVDGRPGVAPPPFTPGDPLIRRPRHSASIDALVTHARCSAYARIGLRGEVLDIDPTYGAFGGKVVARGYRSVSAGGSLRFGRRVEAFGRVVNLFDDGYEEVLGYPAPGRHAMVGLRVTAGR